VLTNLNTIAEFASSIMTGVGFILRYWIPIAILLGATVGLGYLSFLWRNRYLAMIAAGIAFFGFSMVTAYTTGYNYKKAEYEKIMREEQARNLALIIAGQKDAIDELNKENEAEKKRSSELDEILKEIRDAPEKDNGPLAPVLERLLRRIDAERVPNDKP
jgi:hypothetical protein